MVIKIQPASINIGNILNYNEKKANGIEGIHDDFDNEKEFGHIVITVNVNADSTLEDEFNRLKELNLRSRKKVEKPVFHLSINPSEYDKINEKEIVEFTKELMTELGYGDNPYRIYKHNDIKREHYHIVSIRIGKNGKKINDSFENKRCNQIAERLSQKYHFTMGNPKHIENNTTINNENKNEAEINLKEFDKYSEIAFSKQYTKFYNESLKWTFTSFEQYQEIMKFRFHIDIEQTDNGINFTGLDDNEKCTTPINEHILNINAIEQIYIRIEENKKRYIKNQKKRLETTVKEVGKKTKTWNGFQSLLKKKGIYLILHKNKNNELFGVSYIDKATRTAIKGSDTEVDIKWIKELMNIKKWNINNNIIFLKNIKVSKNPYKTPYIPPVNNNITTGKSLVNIINQANQVAYHSNAKSKDWADEYDETNDYANNKL